MSVAYTRPLRTRFAFRSNGAIIAADGASDVLLGALTLASLALFIGLHIVVTRATGADFGASFRVSRGLASVLLSALGFFALFGWREHWATVYVLPAPDALASSLVGVAVGHFLADFALMAQGWRAARERPRFDLVVHHALGLVAAGATLAFPICAPLYLMLFTTELMPVTSGIAALGQLRGARALELAGHRARLAVLLLWRAPLWVWLAVLLPVNLWTREPPPDAREVYRLSIAFLAITASLDAMWIVQSARRLRRLAGAA